MLPGPGDIERRAPSTFADTGVPALLGEVKALGARRPVGVIVGGAQMFGAAGAGKMQVGARNEEAVRAALRAAGIPIVAAETGGGSGRTIRVYLAEARVTVTRRGRHRDRSLRPQPGGGGMSAGAGVLSEEQVAALVAAAKDGQLPDAARQAPVSRRRRVRKIDFTRPSKFTTDQQRRLERAHENFCRSVSTRMSAELRAPISVELIDTAQLTWANALEEVPRRSVSGIVEVAPIERRGSSSRPS